MIKTISKLYKSSSTGKTQVWEIQVEDNKYRTLAGQLNGKTTVSEWTSCSGKNLGQSNETSPQEQAVKEAEAKSKKKIESGYCDDITSVGRAKYFEPMLANKWEDYKYDTHYPVAVQGKLDGIRCIITYKGMFSRNGKPIISAPHIFKSLEYLFSTSPNIILDGELYNHDLKYNFNKIVSLVKKTKPTSDDLKESEKLIQYHCYDMFDSNTPDLIFSNRTSIINTNVIETDYVKKVKTINVSTENELDDEYSNFLNDGYEGMIVRDVFGKYENKRTKKLLKRKDFVDEEYIILDIVEGEGNRSGTAGYMSFKSKNGTPFKSNIKGSFEYLKELLQNKNSIIGKLATIKYFNLTPDGIPRFPYVISIRDYE